MSIYVKLWSIFHIIYYNDDDDFYTKFLDIKLCTLFKFMKKCLQVHLVFHHNLPQLKEDSVGLLYVALNGHHLRRLKRIHKFLQADLLVSIRVELMKQFLNCVATHLRNHLSDHSMKLFKAQGT